MKTGKWICVVPALVLLAGGCARKSQPVSLHDAVRKGDVDAVKKLIARGADVNAEDAQGRTPLYVVADDGTVRSRPERTI
jgi:ankyrin repeat protein